MKLLVDIGNTRLKWALGAQGALLETGASAHAGAPADALRTLLGQWPAGRFEGVWIAHVTGADHEAALRAAAQMQGAGPLHFARSLAAHAGLLSAYSEPQRLGVDRWLAMLAVWTQQPGASVIVDAGTALTVDCVDEQGHHLGGLIAAGLSAQRQAILGSTRFAVADHAAYAAYASERIGRDTERCVLQGALQACVGAVERAAAVLPAARRVLTGGDAPLLAAALGAAWAGGSEPAWEYRPQLVLEGLLRLAESAPKGNGGVPSAPY